MNSICSILLDGDGLGGLWNILIVLFVGAMALLNWWADRAKKKQQQREAQQRARQQPRQVPQAQPTTGRSSQPRPAPSGTARADQMPRYQPEIPSAPGRGQVFPSQTAPARQQEEESELIIVAQDVSAQAARQRLAEQQRREQLRTEAVRRAASQAQRAQRVRQSRPQDKAQAQTAIRPKPAIQEQQEELAPLPAFSGVWNTRSTVLGEVSREQLRRAIVWAEILSPPRALRPLDESFRANQRR